MERQVKQRPVDRPVFRPKAPAAAVKTPAAQVGLAVRSGLHAGQWSCTDCQGEVLGDQLFRPRCSYCMAR
jgi:hypothetical protein